MGGCEPLTLILAYDAGRGTATAGVTITCPSQDREPSILNTPPYCEPGKEQYIDLRAIEGSGEDVEKNGNSLQHKVREHWLRRRRVRREPERAARARELEVEKFEVPSSDRPDDEGTVRRSEGARHSPPCGASDSTATYNTDEPSGQPLLSEASDATNDARFLSSCEGNDARQPSSCGASGMSDGRQPLCGEASATGATSGANELSDARQP